MSEFNSGIYRGDVYHGRYSPRKHSFSYSLYMMALDLDELPQVSKITRLFGTRWFNPLRFKEKDHLKPDLTELRQRIVDKVQTLGGDWGNNDDKVILVTQLRCFGLYFSPINFYFCYRGNSVKPEDCAYMLAEVSNTPWNERHYYLLDMTQRLENDKTFHVSPFMQMDMSYRWKIQPPSDKLSVVIQNIDKHTNDKVFDASMTLLKLPITQGNLIKVLAKFPVMTLKIVLAIYWQALKILFKRIPFIGYPKDPKSEENQTV